MNSCFGTSAYTSGDNINLKLYSMLIFSDETVMAQSGNGAANEGDVTSLGTGQEVKLDDVTLKGEDSYNF